MSDFESNSKVRLLTHVEPGRSKCFVRVPFWFFVAAFV